MDFFKDENINTPPLDLFFLLYLERTLFSAFSFPSPIFVSWDPWDHLLTKIDEGNETCDIKSTFVKITGPRLLITGDIPHWTRQLLRGGVEATTIVNPNTQNDWQRCEWLA